MNSKRNRGFSQLVGDQITSRGARLSPGIYLAIHLLTLGILCGSVTTDKAESLLIPVSNRRRIESVPISSVAWETNQSSKAAVLASPVCLLTAPFSCCLITSTNRVYEDLLHSFQSYCRARYAATKMGDV